jgi:hypothetical protein
MTTDRSSTRPVYILTSETLGRGDDVLGSRLMGSLLRTLVDVSPRPEAIAFLNGAVRLLGPASPHLEALRALDHAGVDLLACATCLEFYELTTALAVGSVSNMREICQQAAGAHHTVTI